MPNHDPNSTRDDCQGCNGSSPDQCIGRYRVQKLLGRGSFGCVYLANDEQRDRLAAVKVPSSNLVSGPEDAERYLTEARAVAKLDHPKIVPIWDMGSTDDVPCFLVSKYVEGHDLWRWIGNEMISPGESARLVIAIAEALDHAHEQGHLHLHVRPGKIMVDQDGTPYLFADDFIQEEQFAGSLGIPGNPSYCSPEQVRGEGKLVDGRTDIYSLGVVMYQLLTSRLPYQADSALDLFREILEAEIDPPSQIRRDVPEGLDDICRRALAKSPQDRYQRIGELADALRRLI